MLRLKTAPTAEPIDLAEVKAHALPIAGDQEPLLLGMITAARQVAEQQLQRTLLTTTWELSLDAWPYGYEIVLPRPPLASVTSVKYWDVNGTQQTLSSAYYFVDTIAEPGRVVLKDTYYWPSLQDGRPMPITIEYVAGWTKAEDVPQAIRQWLLLHVAAQNENRELVGSQNFAQQFAVLPFADGLLDPYRLVEFV